MAALPTDRNAADHLWRRVRRLADEPDGARLRLVRVAADARARRCWSRRTRSSSPARWRSATRLSVYVELLKQGRTSLRLKAEARSRASATATTKPIVAEGEFTFVALDENGQAAGDRGEEETAMADTLRPHRPRLGPRRLCRGDPRRAARPQDRDRRARDARRHLPQLGLHPDQGAAALGRDVPLHAATPTPTASATSKPAFDLAKVVARSRAVAKQLNQGVTHLMKKNKITVVMGEGKLTGKGKLTRHRRGRQGDRACRQAHHRRHRRPGARPAVRQGRRQAHLDLSPRDDPARDADRAAGHRLGRDRDRVRQLLRRPGRQGDGGRDARPRRSGRGCGGQRRARQEPARSRA